MPGVSVVLPTYERPEYLPGAVETALGQTHDDLEVVVVDDGSDGDYANDVAARYDGVRCLVHDDNRGVAAARNTGIDATTGEYVAFLDDDDRWHRTKIARQIDLLERRPDAGIATCLMVSITPDGKVITCQGNAPEGDLSDRILVRNAVGSPSRVLVRRECLAAERFDPHFRTKQDWDLWVRICQDWRVALLPDHLYVRVEHPSISSDPWDAERDMLGVVEKYEDLVSDRGLYDRAMAAYHESVGRTALGAGERSMAREHLRAAARLGATGRGIALLTLAYLPTAALPPALSLKRGIEAVKNDCPGAENLTETVPGVPPSGSP